MFFSKNQAAPLILELPGGKATLGRTKQGGSTLQIEVFLPERRADLTRQSPEVAIQELCEADIALTRETISDLIHALFPLQEQASLKTETKSRGGSSFGRSHFRSGNVLTMREGMSGVCVEFAPYPPEEVAAIVKQQVPALLAGCERTMREVYATIVGNIEQAGR